jgi:hypothetical protein
LREEIPEVEVRTIAFVINQYDLRNLGITGGHARKACAALMLLRRISTVLLMTKSSIKQRHKLPSPSLLTGIDTRRGADAGDVTPKEMASHYDV